MTPDIVGSKSERRPRAYASWALCAATLVGVFGAAPQTAYAQHCRLHYSEAFQVIATRNFSGRTPAQIKQTVDDLFGPRQEVCSEAGYKFFLTGLEAQATAAMRKKGSEQEARLIATREIATRLPLQVVFPAGADPAEGLTQLRANLAVLSTEVGVTPAIKATQDTLAKLSTPKPMVKAMAKDDDAIPITVPSVPLPAWAVISLYEIRDHAAHSDVASITAKTNRILDWVAHASPGVPPAVVPPMPPAVTK